MQAAQKSYQEAIDPEQKRIYANIKNILEEYMKKPKYKKPTIKESELKENEEAL